MFKVIINGVEQNALKHNTGRFLSVGDFVFSLKQPFVIFYRSEGGKVEFFGQPYDYSGKRTYIKANYAISDGINCSICFGDPLNPKDSDIITDINGLKFTFPSVDYVKYAGGAFKMDIVGLKGSPKPKTKPEPKCEPKDKSRETFLNECAVMFDKYFKN